jgi:hypothetical protein
MGFGHFRHMDDEEGVGAGKPCAHSRTSRGWVSAKPVTAQRKFSDELEDGAGTHRRRLIPCSDVNLMRLS